MVSKFVAFILPPAQRLRVLEKFKLKLQEEANKKQKLAGIEFGNGKNSSSPFGEKLKSDHVHTDKELAKMAGIGTGTVARYNQIIRFL